MEKPSPFPLAFLLKGKCKLTKMIPTFDLLFNTIISRQRYIHFRMRGFLFLCLFFPVLACLPICLALRANEASIIVQQRQMGPEGVAAMVTGCSSQQPQQGPWGLDASLRSEVEVLCDFRSSIFLPVIICTLIFSFIPLLLFCILQE